jgi:hypothetical protein
MKRKSERKNNEITFRKDGGQRCETGETNRGKRRPRPNRIEVTLQKQDVTRRRRKRLAPMRNYLWKRKKTVVNE